MDQKIQQELLDKSSKFLDQAAHMLGQTAAHVYGVLIRQQIIDGIASLLSLGLLLAITVYPCIWIVKKCLKWQEKDQWATGPDILMILGPAAIVAAGLFICYVVQASVEQILNPEYFAIKFIFDSVTNN